MTKFRGPFVSSNNNLFSQVMSSRDRETFVLAFSPGKAGDTKKLANARAWVNDVIRLWADKIDINHGLAFQVVCSGSVDVVRRNFQRRLEKHKGTLADIHAAKVSGEQRAYNLEQYHKVESALEAVTHMDHPTLADMLRRPFVDLLSLRHPGTQVHDFSGHVSAKKGEEKKVGDGANPKPRSKPNKGRKVVVEHRTIEDRQPVEMAS
jgi:hypothetical protein